MNNDETVNGVPLPTLGIGIPVFNGENYLEETLQSLLAQTFQDFEIIVSDNASTDGTQQLCRRFASMDRRIRYVRSDVNRGAVANFNSVFAMSRNRYFKWAPHDDLYDPTYLAKCMAVMESDPTIVLCHSNTALINARSRIIGYETMTSSGRDDRTHERFRALLFNYTCYQLFGVIRTSALLKTPLLGGFGHADGILLVQLAMRGRFFEVGEFLYMNRIHNEKSRVHYSTYAQYAVWLDPTNEGKILFPRWRMGYEYIRSIRSVPLPAKEALWCYLHMLSWAVRFWKSLIANLVMASLQFVLHPADAVRKKNVGQNRNRNRNEQSILE